MSKKIKENLIGKYFYNEKKKEYKSTKAKQGSRSESIHSIRLGDYKQTLWINFKDYSTYSTDYVVTNTGYLFNYNNTKYIISKQSIRDYNNEYKTIQLYNNK